MARFAAARRLILASGMYLLLGGAGLFCRYQQVVVTRGDFVPGDQKDTRFGIFLLEHWARVFSGRASWRSPPFFFPARGGLGFSDSFFLFTPAYLPLRALGLDPYTAYQIVLILFSALGFAGMALLLRRYLHIDPVLSAVGGLLFAFSSMLHRAHFQLQMVALVPFLMALALEAVRQRRQGHPNAATWLAAFCLALYGGIAFSSFHVAWYTGLFGAIFFGLSAIATVRQSGVRAPAGSVVRWVRGNAGRLACLAVIASAASIPIAAIYLPVYRSSPGYRFALGVHPSPIDLINVGPDNAAWGSLLQALWAVVPHRPDPALEKGFGLALVAVFAWTVGRLWLRRRRLSPNARSILLERNLMFAAWSVGVAWLLVVQVRHASLLPILRLAIPGTNAIRDFARIHIVMSVVVVAIAMVGVQSLVASEGSTVRPSDRWWRNGAALALVGVFALETQALQRPPGFSKAEERAYLARFRPPPLECRSFYGVVSDSSPRPPSFHSVDAMLIGQRLGIPTINGNTTQTPRDWDRALADQLDRHYLAAVHRWARSHGISRGLCELDLDRATWRRPTESAEPAGPGF